MGNLKTKELDKIGYNDDRLKSMVINTVTKHFKHQHKTETLALLALVKANPAEYIDNIALQKIAEALINADVKPAVTTFELKQEASPLKIYGEDEIEEVAKNK